MQKPNHSREEFGETGKRFLVLEKDSVPWFPSEGHNSLGM
jgi:hypothetical protein